MSNCGCKIFLQFKGWFLTVKGSKDDLKGILTLQPTCSIFHLLSYVPMSFFSNFALPWKIWTELKSMGWQNLKECSWWKLLRRTSFPAVSCVLSPKRRFFLRRQTLTSGWSPDIAHGRVSATSLLDCHEGSWGYKHLIWSIIWCPERWLGLQVHVQTKDVGVRKKSSF